MAKKKNNKLSIGGIRAYFIRGHGGWLLYGVWFLVQISILYVLLGSEVPAIQTFFGNIMTFAAIFIVSYICLATLIGYIDIEIKGIYGQESGVYWEAIPQIQQILGMLTKLIEMIKNMQGKIDELEKTIEEMSKGKEK